MTLKDVMLKINNLEKNLLALVSRGYGDIHCKTLILKRLVFRCLHDSLGIGPQLL